MHYGLSPDLPVAHVLLDIRIVEQYGKAAAVRNARDSEAISPDLAAKRNAELAAAQSSYRWIRDPEGP